MNIQELNELIRLHGAAVYSFCCRLAANRPDAEDLYQETFLKATELCHKIDRYDNPKAFLLAIALRRTACKGVSPGPKRTSRKKSPSPANKRKWSGGP